LAAPQESQKKGEEIAMHTAPIIPL
jgi:hypothetical protein